MLRRKVSFEEGYKAACSSACSFVIHVFIAHSLPLSLSTQLPKLLSHTFIIFFVQLYLLFDLLVRTNTSPVSSRNLILHPLRELSLLLNSVPISI